MSFLSDVSALLHKYKEPKDKRYLQHKRQNACF
jgi:hypothetical protein